MKRLGSKYRNLKYEDLIGKIMLIGITEVHNGEIVQETQCHGTVIFAEENKKIEVLLDDGSKYSVPPQINNVMRAKKGLYTEQSTGLSISNPDFISTWVIETNDYKRVPERCQPENINLKKEDVKFVDYDYDTMTDIYDIKQAIINNNYDNRDNIVFTDDFYEKVQTIDEELRKLSLYSYVYSLMIYQEKIVGFIVCSSRVYYNNSIIIDYFLEDGFKSFENFKLMFDLFKENLKVDELCSIIEFKKDDYFLKYGFVKSDIEIFHKTSLYVYHTNIDHIIKKYHKLVNKEENIANKYLKICMFNQKKYSVLLTIGIISLLLLLSFLFALVEIIVYKKTFSLILFIFMIIFLISSITSIALFNMHKVFVFEVMKKDVLFKNLTFKAENEIKFY